jgi:hypothetical protein
MLNSSSAMRSLASGFLEGVSSQARLFAGASPQAPLRKQERGATRSAAAAAEAAAAPVAHYEDYSGESKQARLALIYY